MRKYQIFLAYYTFIVSSSLFISAFIFAPKPEGFFLALLLIPISLYFYLLISGTFKAHAEAKVENKNLNLKFPFILMTLFFISSFAIFFYSISNQQTLSKEIISLKKDLERKTQNQESYKQISEELKEVKSAIAVAKTKKTEASVDESASGVGAVTINDSKYQTVDVYEKKTSSSNIIGKAEYGREYTFIEKTPNWYLILLPDLQTGIKEGYIGSLFVKEIEYKR